MNSTFADSTLKEIERQIKEIELFQSDEKENSYFAKYLVVFITGSFESIIESILCEYAQRKGNMQIANYVSKTLDLMFRNPDTDKILTTLDRFESLWTLEIKKLSNANTKAIDSIISHKNELAHTGNSTITLSSIKELFNRAKPVIEKIDSIVLNQNTTN